MNEFLDKTNIVELVKNMPTSIVVANDEYALFSGDPRIKEKINTGLEPFIEKFYQLDCIVNPYFISDEVIVIMIDQRNNEIFSDKYKESNFNTTCRLLDALEIRYEKELVGAICDYPYEPQRYDLFLEVPLEEMSTSEECIERISDSVIYEIAEQIPNYIEYYSEILQIKNKTIEDLRQICGTALLTTTLMRKHMLDKICEIENQGMEILRALTPKNTELSDLIRFCDLSWIITEKITNLKIVVSNPSQILYSK